MSSGTKQEGSVIKKLFRIVLGEPKSLDDTTIFHKLALIPFFAWVGLGADGLSSSAYGPEEAFMAISGHEYLAIFLAIATALTVFIISFAYSKIIEHFPHGGGGYVVATQTLGKRAGVVSGSALIVDYILTITVSIAACADAVFSYLPSELHNYKIVFASTLILILLVLNLRGLKESITILTPIFLLFVITHIILLGYGIISHLWGVETLVQTINSNFEQDLESIGIVGIALIFIKAYSLGGGTYTGIEAVSNGIQTMREPRVHSGKRTMLYMALSLSIASAGLFLCYLLLGIKPITGKTLNSVLADSIFANFPLGGTISFITIFSEGALLFVAAQTGFVDAPRVMANMAIDHWLPRRFAAYSEQLTIRNSILIVGISALILLIYTHGSIRSLVVMYAINVFLTFSLSQFGMIRYYFKRRSFNKRWKRHISIFFIGFLLSSTVLTITIFEKFLEGGWLTLLITYLLVLLCYLVKNHYEKVAKYIKNLENDIEVIKPTNPHEPRTLDKAEPTAIQLVSGYNGFGIHTFLEVLKSFPNLYKNYIFVSVAVIDQGLFKGGESIEHLKQSVKSSLEKYVDLAQSYGYNADYRMGVGTDVVEIAPQIISELIKEFPNSVVFSGKLVFGTEKFYHRLLHNEAAYTIQKKLVAMGITNVILPIKVLGK
jgi:amino acid transporter